MGLVIKGYSAPDVVGKCERAARLHTQVLERYGFRSVTSAQQGWWHNRQTSVLLLEDAATAEILGAIRMQRWRNGERLPTEAALAEVDGRVHAWVASFSRGGVAELCGLWCSPKLKGYHLGMVLMRMGLSLASQVDAKTIVGICDGRLLPQNLSLGYMHDPSLASQGTFDYPKPGTACYVLRIPDAQSFATATPENRELIEHYRREPVGREAIVGPWGSLELVRDLRLDASVAQPQRGAAPGGTRRHPEWFLDEPVARR